MLNIVDEFSRECLAMVPQRRLRSDDVLAVLADLFVEHGPPEHVRSDNGPEFAAKAVRAWLGKVGVKTLFIEPGSPWENGYIESFNARLRDELLNGEIFYTLDEVRVVTGWWRDHYNKLRPHSALGYRPPAPEAVMPSWPLGSATLRSAPPPVQLGIGRPFELASHLDHFSQAVQRPRTPSRLSTILRSMSSDLLRLLPTRNGMLLG